MVYRRKCQLPKIPTDVADFDEKIRANPEMSKYYKEAVYHNGEPIAATFASDGLLAAFGDAEISFFDGTYTMWCLKYFVNYSVLVSKSMDPTS